MAKICGWFCTIWKCQTKRVFGVCAWLYPKDYNHFHEIFRLKIDFIKKWRTYQVRRGAGRRSLERGLRRGWMRGRRWMTRGHWGRRSVAARRCEVLGFSPSKGLSLFFGIEGPVLRYVIPNIPFQVVGIVFHGGNRFDYNEQLLFILVS